MTQDAEAVLCEDPVMAELVEAHGSVAVEPAEDPFRRFATSIINQQLSSASAAAIRDRLFDRIAVTPQGVLAADEQVLRDAGLSGQKTEYLRNVAAWFDEAGDVRARFDGVADEAVIAELTDIHGVGAWTANMFLLFVLGRPDVFPVGDLGIRRAMTDLYGLEDRDAMVRHAERWAPYRSHAARYLWRHAD